MAKKKRKAKRRYVNRNERTGPTRETQAKLPVDPFPEWNRLGEAGGGLEPQQTTALLAIADAFASVTAKLGYKPMVYQWQSPGAPRDMSPVEERAWTCWFAWATHFERLHQFVEMRQYGAAPPRPVRVRGFHVAQWVVYRDRKTNAGDTAHPYLAPAADLWRTIRSDYDRGVTVCAADYHPAIDRAPAEPERTRIRTWAQPAPA